MPFRESKFTRVSAKQMQQLFNIFVNRIAYPYSTENLYCKSQPQASPFSHLMKDISKRTGHYNKAQHTARRYYNLLI